MHLKRKKDDAALFTLADKCLSALNDISLVKHRGLGGLKRAPESQILDM